jgi:hypothetical protein
MPIRSPYYHPHHPFFPYIAPQEQLQQPYWPMPPSYFYPYHHYPAAPYLAAPGRLPLEADMPGIIEKEDLNGAQS